MYAKRSKEKSQSQIHLVSIDDLVPKDHLLRKIDAAINFDFIYDEVEGMYSDFDGGRPGIDPVSLFKIVMIQYLFGIRSMRQTIKEIESNYAYRWFIGYDIGEPVPHFSTFGKNYSRRFEGTDIFERIFMHILDQAVMCGFVDARAVFIDGTHIKANANKKKFTKEEIEASAKRYQKELDAEIDKDRAEHGKKPFKREEISNGTPSGNDEPNVDFDETTDEAFDEVIDEVPDETIEESLSNSKETSEEPDCEEPTEENQDNTSNNSKNKSNKKTKIITKSTTDPECGMFHKGEHERQFAYIANTVCDKNNFVLAFTMAAGNMNDSVTFDDVYKKVTDRFPKIESIVVDAGYKTPWIAKKIIDDGRVPVMPYKRPMTKKGFFKKYEYVYDEYYDCVICPNDQILKYSTTNRDGRKEYKSDPKVCANCPLRSKCTESKNCQKVVTRHVWEEYLEQAEDYRHTPKYKALYEKRKETIERVFADAKEKHNMRYTQYRGLAKVTAEAMLRFACMNLKKLANWKWNGGLICAVLRSICEQVRFRWWNLTCLSTV